jgi:putative transposase
MDSPATGRCSDRRQRVAAMVVDAKARGLELAGPNGLLKLFTRNVLKPR